jgi:HEAT repeat protein
LVAIARDRDRPRDTRRSAISWLARVPDATAAEVTRALMAIARDDDEPPTIRTQAVSTLGRLPDGAGIEPLSVLAADRQDLSTAREAIKVLARSGDPRVRGFLRSAVADAGLPPELRSAAVSGVGNDMATGADAKLLRDTYARVDDTKTKEAVISAVAAVGGAPNVDWLLAVARDGNEPAALRRRAISLSPRAGATGEQLARLFDQVDNTDAKTAVISALSQEGSRAAREKLVAIAQSSELPALRRRAISALERLDGPEARAALAGIAVRPNTR